MSRLILLFMFLLFSDFAIAQIFESTHLPLVVIQTENGSPIINEPRVDADMKIIFHESEENKLDGIPNIYDGKINIEIRGQTSQWIFDKKSYRLETQDENGNNRNVELLGMPSENDWILQGPYSDKTLIRNLLIYELSRKIGKYAIRTRLCELFINEEYIGVYVLMENIKRDKNRLDISKMDDDIEGNALTGGYIFRMDKHGPDEPNLWTSNYLSLTDQELEYQVVYPKTDDLQPQQMEYLVETVNKFEESVLGDNYQDPNHGYRKFIDENSFIDFFILNELARNPDAYRISTYYHKDRDDKNGKIIAGPIWDFNLGFGNVNFCAGSSHQGWIRNYHNYCPDDPWQVPIWWDRLFSDPKFSQKTIDRWKTLRSDVFSTSNIYSIIDSLTNLIGDAQQRNFTRWPVLGTRVWPNDFVGQTYESEISYLKNWLSDRLKWIDDNIEAVSGIKNGSLEEDFFSTFPNPFSDNFSVKLQSKDKAKYQLNLFDVTGRKLLEWKEKALPEKLISKTFTRKVNHLSKGVYFIQILVNDKLIKTEKLLKI